MGVSWEKALAALLRALFEDGCRATALADRECGPQADLSNQECIFLWSEVWAGHQQPPCDTGVSQAQGSSARTKMHRGPLHTGPEGLGEKGTHRSGNVTPTPPALPGAG